MAFDFARFATQPYANPMTGGGIWGMGNGMGGALGDITGSGSTGAAASGGYGGALSGLLDPSVALPAAAAMIGGSNLQESLSGGLAAAAPGIGQMKKRKALSDWFKAGAPKDPKHPASQALFSEVPELATKYVGAQLGGDTQYGMTPIWGRDPKTGKTVLMQMRNTGGISPVDTGGVEPLDPLHFVDTATGTAAVGSRTGQIRQTGEGGGVIAKDLSGAAAAKAAGQTQGELAAVLPSTLAKAENALKTIADIRSDPALSGGIGGSGIGGTGALSFLNAFPGTAAYDFQQKVDQLKGQAFLDAYKDLKGGGAITETEGQKATQAIARLSTAQTEAAFIKALDDLEEVVTKGMERAKAMAVPPPAVPEPARSAAPASVAPWNDLGSGVRMRRIE